MADAARPPFAFGMKQFTTQPWSFEQDADRYAALGIEAIDICRARLDNVRFADQMVRVADSGLTINAVKPMVRTFGPSAVQPEPHDMDARVDRLQRSIERLAHHAPGCPFVVDTGAPVDGDVAGMVDATIERPSAPVRARRGDRLVPGDGAIPIGPRLRAVHATGFAGAGSVEIFSAGVSDSLYRQDLERIVRRSRDGFERAWAGASSSSISGVIS